MEKRKVSKRQMNHLKKVHDMRSKKSRSTPEFYAAVAFYEENNCDKLTFSETAFLLNHAGHRTPRGRPFCNAGVLALRRKIKLNQVTPIKKAEKVYAKNLFDDESFKIYGKPMAALTPDERAAVRASTPDKMTKQEFVEMILSLCEYQYRKGVQQGHSMGKRGIITEKQAYDFRYKDKNFNRAKCVLGGKGQYSIIGIIEMEPFVRTYDYKKQRLKDIFIDFLKENASEKQKEIYKNNGV